MLHDVRVRSGKFHKIYFYELYKNMWNCLTIEEHEVHRYLSPEVSSSFLGIEMLKCSREDWLCWKKEKELKWFPATVSRVYWIYMVAVGQLLLSVFTIYFHYFLSVYCNALFEWCLRWPNLSATLTRALLEELSGTTDLIRIQKYTRVRRSTNVQRTKAKIDQGLANDKRTRSTNDNNYYQSSTNDNGKSRRSKIEHGLQPTLTTTDHTITSRALA